MCEGYKHTPNVTLQMWVVYDRVPGSMELCSCATILAAGQCPSAPHEVSLLMPAY